LADKGIKTALAMLDNQFMGRPLEYYPEDNASDPVLAVDKARKLVESDGINVMIGPIFSPSAKAVTEYLGTSSGIPQMSIVGQPSENLETASGLAFIHTGFFDSHGYYFGKYLAELGYNTANVINYDDTPAYALTAGFKKAFVDEGGGEVLSENYVPLDMVDFSAYLTTMRRPTSPCTGSSATGPCPSSSSTTTMASPAVWRRPCPTTSATRSWPTWVT